MPRLSLSLGVGLDRVFIVSFFSIADVYLPVWPFIRPVTQARQIYRAGYIARGFFTTMSHVEKEKKKLLNRLRRLRGQLDAIERAVEADEECARVIQQASACRGALDGFIAEIIEDHILEHMVDPAVPRSDPRTKAVEELVAIVHSYLT